MRGQVEGTGPREPLDLVLGDSTRFICIPGRRGEGLRLPARDGPISPSVKSGEGSVEMV